MLLSLPVQSPPAFSFAVTRSRRAGGVLLAFSALSLLWLGLWTLDGGESGGQALLFLAILIVVQLILLCRLWFGMPVGALRWSGETWHWLPSDEPNGVEVSGPIEVCLDLLQGQLLRFRPEGRRQLWLWVDKPMDPSAWYALRRALAWRSPRVGHARAAAR